MATNTALIASIVNDPSAHFVDKSEKMNRTMDKIIDNKIKLAKQQTGESLALDESRGYGKGRNQGD